MEPITACSECGTPMDETGFVEHLPGCPGAVLLADFGDGMILEVFPLPETPVAA